MIDSVNKCEGWPFVAFVVSVGKQWVLLLFCVMMMMMMMIEKGNWCTTRVCG